MDTETRLAELRAIAQQRRLTDDEAKEAVQLVRGDRISAAYASANSGAKKAASKKVSPEEALAKLMAAKKNLDLFNKEQK